MSIVKMFKKENKIFRIYNDISPEKPGVFGRILHWHRTRDFGEYIRNKDRAAVKASKDWVIFQPLYLYEHGDVMLSLIPFADSFDSGQLGYVAVTAEELQEEYEGNKEEAIKRITRDLLTYTAYLNGEVYEWDLQEVTTCKECGHILGYETIGGYGGYYGVDSWDQMKKDAGVDETWEETN